MSACDFVQSGRNLPNVSKYGAMCVFYPEDEIVRSCKS